MFQKNFNWATNFAIIFKNRVLKKRRKDYLLPQFWIFYFIFLNIIRGANCIIQNFFIDAVTKKRVLKFLQKLSPLSIFKIIFGFIVKMKAREILRGGLSDRFSSNSDLASFWMYMKFSLFSNNWNSKNYSIPATSTPLTLSLTLCLQIVFAKSMFGVG